MTFLDPPAWHTHAACREIGPDLFYADKGENDIVNAAKKICNTLCEVRDTCLDAAMREEEGQEMRHGVRGGLSANERDHLARRDHKTCRDCNTPIPRERRYCDTHRAERLRAADAAKYRRHDAAKQGRPAPEHHPWQDRPRPRMRRASEGSGPVVTARGHVPIPTEPKGAA